MKQKKKRPNYVEEVLIFVNTMLMQKKVKSASDPLCIFIERYLFSKNMYRGYSMFNLNEQGHPVLAGSAENYDFIQYF